MLIHTCTRSRLCFACTTPATDELCPRCQALAELPVPFELTERARILLDGAA